MSPCDLRKAIGGWAWFSVTAGGLGHLWPASGTWGSLPPALLFMGMAWWGAPLGLHAVAQVLVCVLASVACVRHGAKVEAATGRKDPGVVVIDEVAGMALTLALVVGLVVARHGPGQAVMPTSLGLALAAVGFFWFRVMDVIKPPPARGLQALPGGMGVLVDDLVVAPYAALAVVASIELWVSLQPVG